MALTRKQRRQAHRDRQREKRLARKTAQLLKESDKPRYIMQIPGYPAMPVTGFRVVPK